MNGKLYGVGIGPGDPELLTLKAIRIIKESDVIAVPGDNVKDTVAYKIVKGAYDRLDEKALIPVSMPMIKDPVVLKENHRKGADQIEKYLSEGKNVAFLTLGDPTIYSTYMYVHKIISQRGYETEIINGIPSFCAVAAKLNTDLTETSDELHVIPGTYNSDKMSDVLALHGTKVLMKSGKKLKQVRDGIIENDSDAVMIENCGMPDEKIYKNVQEIPEQAGYYTLIIVKDKNNE